MTFLTDVQELKPGLVLFRRADVKHRNWYCRIKVPKEDRYKTISLKTPDLNEARDKAFDHDADIRFRVKHEVPIFDKSFAEVAAEYLDFQKGLVQTGQIQMRRWKCVESYIRLHLIPYAGNIQITLIGEDKWKSYPLWRKQHSARPDRKKHHDMKSEHNDGADQKVKADTPPPEVKGGTIRHEMIVFRGILNFAAGRRYIREGHVPKNRLPADKARREEFTPQEYRHLHTFARKWLKEGRTKFHIWYRTMAYNFLLVMANTGMRPPEANNLRWRDVDIRADRHGRKFVCINVRGKDKYRELIATENVASYLDRIRGMSKASAPDDFVFSNHKGAQAASLYDSSIENLLKESGLLISSSGSRRSTYCFRHTYATFRLMEGVDVYFLAKQMGTSVKMIEDYYGHITPAKSAERILQGIPGWEPIADNEVRPSGAPRGETSGGVNASRAGLKAAKPRTKK